MRVLVLDGNENQAVACVRSLARSGHSVVVGSDASWSKAGWSRFCVGTFRYTAPQQDASAFIEDILAEVKREPGTLVLPMTERATLPLSAEREKVFKAGGRLVLPPHETLVKAFDKQQTTRLAESLGIAIPHTSLVCDTEQARSVAASSRYPLVLKARTSEELSPEGKVQATGAPLYARDAKEFLEGYAELRRHCSSVLAQEFVEGDGAGYFALMKDGELRMEFAHRRIRDVRPTGSGSSVRESVKAQARLRESALAILRELRWHGVAMVEFRLKPDGTPVFLEVNGRFWNSLPLAVYAGADFPSLLAQMAEHGDVEPVMNYREGVRCRWLLGDFRHLLEVWRGAPKGFPGAFPGRARTLIDFLTPVGGTFHDNFMWRDPLPELGDWLDFFFRRLPSRLGKRSTPRKDVDVQRGYSLP
jgi:predicted ATP-grasp superfamily ATP-dependent carboligase